jgi:hypothetical protein
MEDRTMTAAKPIPLSIEELESIFTLDWENGQLIRRVPVRGPAPKDTSPAKYRLVSINGKQYMHHRLIWMMASGQTIPDGMQVDHINRDKHDNRPSNLRLATGSQNRCNTGKPSSNRTGFKGVSYCRTRRRLQATIKLNGMQHKLGWFVTAEEAAEAYDRAAIELHGEHGLTNVALGLLPEKATRARPCTAISPANRPVRV